MRKTYKNEGSWQADVLSAARALGWRCYHTYDSRRSAPGFPDLIMCRGTRLLAIELKTTKGRATLDQLGWLASLKTAGAETGIWRPEDWDDVVIPTLQYGGSKC